MPDSVPPANVTLEPGTVLDRYELLCTIARGGMAHVWLGRFKGKHGFEKLVAVKTILPEHALDTRFRAMFLDEARIASGVEHPHVAKILDLGEWHECLYLVMEYVDGDSLSRMRRSVEKRGLKLPLPISLRVLADVCAGLHAAHELHGDDGALLNVVHRDVSPQNVLIPTNGVAKLIDFGVAKARHRLGEETSAGFAKGKSRYMSPEQALSKEVDRRADIFAVGAMAYELFEGNAPYDGPNDMARLHALMTGLEIQEVKKAPHPAVEKLIVKALSREPDARFATANEMRAAIEDAMVMLKVRASPDDVAAFVVAHTSERIAERKGVVKVAHEAAAERQRIKDVLSMGTVSGRPAQGSAPEISSSNGKLPPSPESQADLPEVGKPDTETPPPAAVAESAAPGAFSASVPEGADVLPERNRPRLTRIVAAAAGLVLVSLVLAFVVRGSSRSRGASTAATPAASSVAPALTSTATPPRPADSTTENISPAPPASATIEAPSGASSTATSHHAVRPKLHVTPRHGQNPHHEVVIQ